VFYEKKKPLALIMLGIAKHYLADNIKQEYSKFERIIKLA